MFRRLLLPWICGVAGPWWIEGIGSSLEWEVRGAEHRAGVRDRSHVLVFWHSRILLNAYFFRHCGYHIPVSENADGEMIARAIANMGNRSLRGSTSRGAARVLMAAARVLRAGGPVAFTPDGPRGPRHRFQPGALSAARLGGAPILPVVASVDRATVFKSWDRFVLPRAGARAIIQFLPPADPPGRDDAEFESLRLALERDMAGATDHLDRELGLRIP